MATKIVVGAQWGDEGKGKIVDLLASEAELVIRFQGGANAGHTVKIADEEFILHMIPSGVLHEGVVSAIGNGVVFDYNSFIEELNMLKSKKKDPTGRLFVSPYANVVMPYHPEYDKLKESQRKSKIGTTARGIGPCYQDKVTRSGIRIMEIISSDKSIFQAKLKSTIEAKNFEYSKMSGEDKDHFDYETIYNDIMNKFEIIKPFVKDVSILTNDYIKEGKKVIFEGAQGTLLDIDFGTFPFVTSSTTISGGACHGTGVGPTKIDEVLGVIKAYTTRVGNGPFVTELFGDDGEKLGRIGGEVGATTGRVRRCGHFDNLIAKYSARVNGLTSIALTKLDVLDGYNKIKVCVAYDYNGERLEEFIPVAEIMDKCTPIYEELDGWNTDITSIKSYKDLPENAKKYISYIEKIMGIPAEIISVGPKRDQSIFRK